MPDDLREELERSAQKRGWSLSQELIWRVRSSYKRQRDEERRPPATKALCFLLSEVSEPIGITHPKWHRSRFAFKAFRLALSQFLEALEPTGEMKKPRIYEQLQRSYRATAEIGGPVMPEEVIAAYETPEALADYVSKRTLESILHPQQELAAVLQEYRRDYPQTHLGVEYLLDSIYGFADARRDLGLEVQAGSKKGSKQ
jgi:hypothetical protein